MNRRLEGPDAPQLRALAERCRRQAKTVSGHGVRRSLLEMAADYELRAGELERTAA